MRHLCIAIQHNNFTTINVKTNCMGRLTGRGVEGGAGLGRVLGADEAGAVPKLSSGAEGREAEH